METFIQALLMAFREGLEAFLIVAILLQFLDKTNNKNLKKHIWHGTYVGIFLSFILGIILMSISSFIGGTDTTTKLWESLASFMAVCLVTTFIIWMITHADEVKKHIENKATLNLSKKGLFFLAMFMVTREGAEIAIFSFAGKYSILPLITGISISIGVIFLFHHSIVNIKLKTILTVTLVYIIFQAGFLMGYSIHEGLSATKNLEIISKNNPVFIKAFDLTKTIFDHKQGIAGVPLYVALGWYSKPEWIQFIVQYSYTFLFLMYWYRKRKKI